MRKLLLATSCAIGVGATPGFAADLPARMPVKAPVAAPMPFTWTGCYVGAHVGAGWGRTEFSDPTGDTIANPGQSFSVTSPGGFLGGGQLGCNYQFASNWVIGLAGDFSWSGIDSQGNDPFFGGKNGIDPLTVRSRTDFIGSVTGRVGYAWNNSLLYGKGGLAFSHNKYEVNNYFCVIFGGACYASGTDQQIGWTLGAGYEWAFARQWSLLIEYGHDGFASKTLTVFDPGHPGVSSDITVKRSFDVVKLGINYRFGGLFR